MTEAGFHSTVLLIQILGFFITVGVLIYKGGQVNGKVTALLIKVEETLSKQDKRIDGLDETISKLSNKLSYEAGIRKGQAQTAE